MFCCFGFSSLVCLYTHICDCMLNLTDTCLKFACSLSFIWFIVFKKLILDCICLPRHFLRRGHQRMWSAAMPKWWSMWDPQWRFQMPLLPTKPKWAPIWRRELHNCTFRLWWQPMWEWRNMLSLACQWSARLYMHLPCWLRRPPMPDLHRLLIWVPRLHVRRDSASRPRGSS